MRRNDTFRINKYKLEGVLASYYIKYDKLIQFMNLIGPESWKSVIDVYVDIYDMVKQLYELDIYTDKRFSITASVLNLAAHIRSFFRTRYRIYSRIYLVYGEDILDNHKKYWPSFNTTGMENTYSYTKIKSLITSQLELVKIMCAYINDVYFIHKQSDFSMFTFDAITTNTHANNENLSIVWTKSKYCYQIPADFIGYPVYLFRPIKTKEGDQSIFVSPTNALTQYYNKLVPNSNSSIQLKNMSPKLLSLIMTFNGCEDKRVNGITNIIRAIEILKKAIDDNKLLNNYQSDTHYIYEVMVPLGIASIMDENTFEYRFKALDVIYQHRIYSQSIESKDFMWNINLSDPYTMMEINAKYFTDNPIDLNNF